MYLKKIQVYFKKFMAKRHADTVIAVALSLFIVLLILTGLYVNTKWHTWQAEKALKEAKEHRRQAEEAQYWKNKLIESFKEQN